MNHCGQENFDLAQKIMSHMGGRSFGAMHNFFNTEPDWVCPSCLRNKTEIARLDKNDQILCRIVEHHDHFVDYVVNVLQGSDLPREVKWSVKYNFCRFPETLICDDCNVQERRGKVAANAIDDFSFSPPEIGCFIKAMPNTAPQVNCEIACELYDAIIPTQRVLAKRVLRVAKGDLQTSAMQIGDLTSPIIQRLAARSPFNQFEKDKEDA